MTGQHPDFVLRCTDPAMRALCDEAGDGRYVEVSSRDGTHRFVPTKLWLEQEALKAVRARMGGNAPVIAHEKGEDGARHVLIDGERRGRWSREGTRWVLSDTTGLRIATARRWSLDRQEGLRSFDNHAAPVWLWLWEESVALANAVQAWEEGLLPPLDEQRSRAAMRRATRNADDLLALLRRAAAGERVTAEAADLLARLSATEEEAP